MGRSKIKMKDISEKKCTERLASASVRVCASQHLVGLIKKGALPKGDCLSAAEVAAMLAAKKTADIIPLCHQINLSFVGIEFNFAKNFIEIVSLVKTTYATGVEMEALVACSAAALTIYDMAKPEEKGIIITDLKLLKKTGGKSGTWVAQR